MCNVFIYVDCFKVYCLSCKLLTVWNFNYNVNYFSLKGYIFLYEKWIWIFLSCCCLNIVINFNHPFSIRTMFVLFIVSLSVYHLFHLIWVLSGSSWSPSAYCMLINWYDLKYSYKLMKVISLSFSLRAISKTLS